MPMNPRGFCMKAACLVWIWCAFLPFSAVAGVMVQKDYVVRQDRSDRILCEMYIVQKNDSLTRIFQEKGGIIDDNPNEFLEIFKRINPDVTDFENVKPGLQVLIPLKKLGPEREVSTRIFTLPMVTISANRPPQPVAEPKTPQASSGYTEYKIKPGDTLSRIFKQYFGISDVALLGEKLRLFQKYNPGIANFDRIHIGQTIRMPVFDDSTVETGVQAFPSHVETVAARLNAKLTQKGIYYFPTPGKADFRLNLERFPLLELSDGLRILINFNEGLTDDEKYVVTRFWPEIRIVDMVGDPSADEMLQRIIDNEPSLAGRLKQGVTAGHRVRSAGVDTEWYFAVSGRRQLVETLMRILGISYTQNVEMSFPYADIQISSHANWIETGQGKPVLVDFGSFYGDAAQSIEKTGFVVVQILDSDNMVLTISRLLTAVGVSYSMRSEIQETNLPGNGISGIWIPRETLPPVFLTDAVLDRAVIRSFQEKNIIVISEKQKKG